RRCGERHRPHAAGRRRTTPGVAESRRNRRGIAARALASRDFAPYVWAMNGKPKGTQDIEAETELVDEGEEASLPELEQETTIDLSDSVAPLAAGHAVIA